MGGRRSPRKRLAAVLVVVAIATGLVAWELYGPGTRVEGGRREVAVILTEGEPFPPILWVEKGVDYRIAVTAAAGRHSLEQWPGAATDVGSTKVAEPGKLAYVDVAASDLRDGEPLGPGGPVVRMVDSLDLLAARGEVYFVGLIAEGDGLVPRQVRLTEGLKAALGGVSTEGTRMLLIEGARLYLPLAAEGVAELLVDVPTPGVYNVLCEEGCRDGRWNGSFRVEGSDSEVPWVEGRDTDAAAELHRRAPDFVLYDATGRIVQLSEFQHDKPVFINFWATWCPPCRREMPAMQELYARRGDELEILAVNYLENRSQVIDFFEELQLQFPALLDVTGDVNSRYGVWSYPTSVFVDREGVVRGRFIGELTPELMEEFIDVITE